MRDHPPDRRLDPPEPTDEELRDARQEEARREEFTRFMNEKVRPTFVDAYDAETADRWMDRIWEEVRRNG